MNYDAVIAKSEQFVKGFIKEHHNQNLLFHTLTHTENVVSASIRIAEHYKISKRDKFICTVAAWFHDIGYFEDMSNHEQVGAKKVEEFLVCNGVDYEIVIETKKCILATKMPQNPTNLLEEIVCDADLFHLGTDDFTLQNKLMREETEAICNLCINKAEWDRGTVSFMENHHYHTQFCKVVLDNGKKRNLEKLRREHGRSPVLLNHWIRNRSSDFCGNDLELNDNAETKLFSLSKPFI